jgi:hypothetical protein
VTKKYYQLAIDNAFPSILCGSRLSKFNFNYFIVKHSGQVFGNVWQKRLPVLLATFTFGHASCIDMVLRSYRQQQPMEDPTEEEQTVFARTLTEGTIKLKGHGETLVAR